MSEEMNHNDVTINDGMGSVSFADEVIAIIAGLAATEVPGVYGMTGNLTSSVQEVLGRRQLSKGVKVEVGKEQAAIDLYCVLEYGSSIAQVARNVQENVKKEVENMTGLTVVECNVHVQGIQFEKEMPPPPPEKPKVEAPPPRVK